jgi:hypothetical protein
MTFMLTGVKQRHPTLKYSLSQSAQGYGGLGLEEHNRREYIMASTTATIAP